MADQADVENAIASIVANALYPGGPSAGSSVGVACRIYRGWPNPAALDADLAAGNVNVTIFPLPQLQSNTTRWLEQSAILAAPAPTLTVATNGITVTFGGSTDAGQVAGILADGVGYACRTATGDAPPLVAANLAALIRANRPVALAGSTVTVPGAAQLVGRVVADQTVLNEVRRQSQLFRISCWCHSPSVRDEVAASVDAALAVLTFVTLADGSAARLRFHSGLVRDQAQNAALYRRDLVYAADYPTTHTANLPSMLFGDLLLNAASRVA